jgi:hypothetical protein
MDRRVTEFVVTPDGMLAPAPNAPWRLEEAVGEANLHRRLASLSPAPEAIAAAASRYGPLRFRADVLSVVPEGNWEQIGLGLGQASLPEWLSAAEWIERGHEGPTPLALLQLRPMLEVLVSLPPTARRVLDLKTTDSDPAELAEALRLAEEMEPAWDGERFVGSIQNAPVLAGDGSDANWPPRTEAFAWAVGLVVRMQSMLAGLDPMPMGLEVGPVIRDAITTMPESLQPIQPGNGDNPLVRLAHHVAEEKVEDWRNVIAEMCAWVNAIELRKRADEGTLLGDMSGLRSLVATLLDGMSAGTEGATTSGEFETLLRPRLRGSLKAKLHAAGVWPYPANEISRTVGTYARALWAVWFEFANERPPQACVTPGCAATFSAHGNRRYCDSCRLLRDRSRKSNAKIAT